MIISLDVPDEYNRGQIVSLIWAGYKSMNKAGKENQKSLAEMRALAAIIISQIQEPK